MSIKVGVASSSLIDTAQAGKTIAMEALAKAKVSQADFAFVFCSKEHDHDRFMEAVKSVLGNKTVIAGGSSMGVITNESVINEGICAAIMVISAPGIKFRTDITPGLIEGEEICGRKAGAKLKKMLKADNPNLLLFYDSVRPDIKDGIPFYQAAPILNGIETEINQWPPVAGVGISTHSWTSCKLWNEKQICSNSIMTLLVSGNIRMDTTIMHGCKPASDYHTITKISHNLILEIDDKPATQVVSEYLGNPEKVDWRSAMFFITLGMNKGEKYGPFKEEYYVNRMVMGMDDETKGLALVEGDLLAGNEFQFMRRCIEPGIVKERSIELVNSIGGRRPLFALYISCAGRIRKIFGSEKEEAEEVQEAIGNIPLLGIYSGVEIAKVRGSIMPLDWTGVLCLFSEPL